MATKNYAHLDSVTGLVLPAELPSLANRTITGTANKISVTNGDGIAGNPTISGPFTAIAVTKTFADVATAALTNEINIASLPINSQVITAAAVVNTPGDVVPTLTLSLGFLGINPTALITAQNGLAVAATPYTGNGSTFINGAVTISSTFVSTVLNLDQMTQGSWTFYISYVTF